MSVTEYKRGTPEFEDESGDRYGLLCETVEECITDKNGLRLDHKLENMQTDIEQVSTDINNTINTEIDKKVGNLSELSIEDKQTIVQAINKLKENLENFIENITQNTGELQNTVESLNSNLVTQLLKSGLLNCILSDTEWGAIEKISNLPVKFFTAWEVYDELPCQYGSGVIIPGLDGYIKFIYYTVAWNTSIRTWIGIMRFMDDTTYTINWQEIITSESIFNQNNLINPNFKINQRGKTVYTSAGYTVDRWRTYTDINIKIGDGYIEIPENSAILQLVENFEDFIGKTMTFSAYTNKGVAKGTITISGSEQQYFYVGDDFQLYHSGNAFGIFSVTGITLYWAKLEFGTIATQFIPPDPAEELAKCQRYYREIVKTGCIVTTTTGNLLQFSVTFNLSMRTKNPTVSFKNDKFNVAHGTAIVENDGSLIPGFSFTVGNVSSWVDGNIYIMANKDSHGLSRTSCYLIIGRDNPVCVDAEIY